jgi:hypothetical protein
MRNIFLIALAAFALGGCQSEVDKCVAQWEKANPNDEGTYCQRYAWGECKPGRPLTKDEALVEVRTTCMRASSGK